VIHVRNQGQSDFDLLNCAPVWVQGQPLTVYIDPVDGYYYLLDTVLFFGADKSLIWYPTDKRVMSVFGG
jgi:hypothetical protein